MQTQYIYKKIIEIMNFTFYYILIFIFIPINIEEIFIYLILKFLV